MAATRVVMHQIVLPAEVDSLGICFGGQVSSPFHRSRDTSCMCGRMLFVYRPFCAAHPGILYERLGQRQ